MPSYKDPVTKKWYCQFYYNDWTGARKHTSKHGFERKKDADEYEKEFKNQFKPRMASTQALLAAYDKNLDNRVSIGNLKQDTANKKRQMIRLYIEPYFGKIPEPTAITPVIINNWLAQCTAKLAIPTMRNIRSELNQILKFAMRNNSLQSNPMALSEPLPKVKTKNKRVKMLTPEQYELFRNELPNEPYKVFFDTMYWGGLRIGETCAIARIDVQPYYIRIRHTFVNDKDGGHFNEPKTDDSKRKVQIPHFLYFRLKRYMETIYIDDKERIFPFKPQNAYAVMVCRINKLGLPPSSPHTLRHSYASLLLNITKDFAVVAAQLGHSNVRTTIETYSHMIPTKDRAGVDELEKQLYKGETIDISVQK